MSCKRAEQDKEHREYFYKTRRELFGFGYQGSVHGFLKRLVEDKYHRRQNRDAAQHAEQHALCHDDSQISSEREGHEAQRDESRDGRYRASENRGDGLVYRLSHRFPVV